MGLPANDQPKQSRRAAVPVGGPVYNVAVAKPRDDFPNQFVGDLLRTDRSWVGVPPICCPDGHDYTDPGWCVGLTVCDFRT